MLIAILVLSILTLINSALLVLILLSIYGKCNDIIEYKERQSQAIIEIAKGVVEGLNKNDTHKTI